MQTFNGAQGPCPTTLHTLGYSPLAAGFLFLSSIAAHPLCPGQVWRICLSFPWAGCPNPQWMHNFQWITTTVPVHTGYLIWGGLNAHPHQVIYRMPWYYRSWEGMADNILCSEMACAVCTQPWFPNQCLVPCLGWRAAPMDEWTQGGGCPPGPGISGERDRKCHWKDSGEEEARRKLGKVGGYKHSWWGVEVAAGKDSCHLMHQGFGTFSIVPLDSTHKHTFKY